MNEFELAKQLTPIIRESLFEIESIRNIAPIDTRDDLGFEIEGIAQAVARCSNDIELAREMAKYFEVSFDGKFAAKEFIEAARKTLEVAKVIRARNEQDI